jgi:hypothetical protein
MRGMDAEGCCAAGRGYRRVRMVRYGAASDLAPASDCSLMSSVGLARNCASAALTTLDVVARKQAHQHVGINGQHGGAACAGGRLA